MVIVLDTFPLSSVTKLPTNKITLSDQCRKWVNDCEAAGHRMVVPAVSYYEVLRELELNQAKIQIEILKNFCFNSNRFLLLTTEHLEKASKLWAEARRFGYATADPKSLDCDVILAAQALSLGSSAPDLIVATTNPSHISRYVSSDLWANIHP